MAKIKIVGRQGLVIISQRIADKLIEAKDKYEPDHLVDVGAEGIMELGQIKQIISDDPMALKEMEINEKREQERQNAMVEWNEYVNRCRREGVEQKARRMVATWCMLCWAARGNRPATQISKEVSDELMIRLIDFFDKNPNEWTCGMKEYQDLIPFDKTVNIASVKGFTTFVDAMQTKLL